jgi:hypothetical protein
MRGRYFPWCGGESGSPLLHQASPGGKMLRAEPGPTGGGPSWRAIRRLLTALVLTRGVILMCVLPPLEGWDEYQHVAYVHSMHETGRRPVYDEAVVPRALLESVLKHPQGCDALKELRPFGAVGYAEYWARRDAGDPMTPTPAGTLGLYEAQHGPLYYRLAAPLYAALGGEKDLRRSVAGLRVANLLLIVGAVWVALGAIGRLVRDVRHSALIGLVVAAHPLFLVNGVRVANDALGTFLATVAIAGALTLDGRHLTRRALWVGPVIGFAVLAKAVHLALAPFAVALWLAVVVLDRVPTRRAVIALAVLALGILAPTLSQFAEDLARYGNLTPMVEAIVNRRAGRTAADLLRTAVGMNWPRFVVSWWARKGLMVGGWSFLLPPRWLVDCYTLLVGLGLSGWSWSALGRGGRVFRSAMTSAACAALAASYTAALAYHAIHSTAVWGFAATNAWYAAAAMPWFLALVAGGALGWPLGPLRFAGPALMGLAFIVAEGAVIWGAMTTTYAGGLGGSAGLVRLAALQPPGLGTATLFAATLGALALLVAWAVAFVRLGTAAESPPPRGPHAEAGRLGRPTSMGLDTVHMVPSSLIGEG